MKLDVDIEDDRNRVAKIYLDGCLLEHWVFAADEEAGTVTQAVISPCGKPAVRNGEILRETVTGKVEIKLPEGYSRD